MTLNLKVVKFPDAVRNFNMDIVFGENGGALGRGDGNDFTLPDPDRFLSSKHCVFSVEFGQFYLTDTSTNGTFLNGSPEPIGKGGKVPINEGDQIELGDYVFVVTLVERNLGAGIDGGSVGFGNALDDPFANEGGDDVDGLAKSSGVGNGSELTKNADGLKEDYFSSSEPLHRSNLPLGDSGDGLGVDPLEMFSNEASGAKQPPNSFIEDDPFASVDPLSSPKDYWSDGSDNSARQVVETQSDNSDALNEAISWPNAESPKGIPENWDDEPLDIEPSSGALESSAPEIDNVTREPSQDEPLRGAKSDSLGGLLEPKGDIDADYFAAPAKKQIEPELPLSAEAGKQRRLVNAGVQEHIQSAEDADPQGGLAKETTPYSKMSLLKGLGLDQDNLTDEQINKIHETVGELLPVIVDGMMTLLRARATIKNEFRMNVTTIQPVENNPLKFSANVDDAIDNLFVRNRAAFKEPLEAFQEGFDTINEHQVAVIAGVRSAFEGLVKQFDPDHLERQFQRQGGKGLIPGMQKTKYWPQYRDYFKTLFDNLDTSFQSVFGDSFVDAYEEQLRNLSTDRRRPK